MDFAYTSAGPSTSSVSLLEEQQPGTSISLLDSNKNVNWQLPTHLSDVLNDNELPNKRLFIYNRTDEHIQLDMRAFYNCMEYEEHLQPNYHYFTAVQDDITPFHREQAIDWIYDVAKEEKCDGDVFLLAVALVDRFLSIQTIMKHDVQMVAGVALFIASKLKAPHPLTANKIAYYSDNSCPVDMLLRWELLVCTTLNWETESPTAFSFFDKLASRIPEIHNLRAEFQLVVQKCQRMHKLATLFPSMQCAITLYYVSNLPHQSKELAAAIKSLLANMFQLQVNLLDSYIPMVDRCLNPTPIYTAEEKVPVPAQAPIAAPEETDGDDEEEEEEEEEMTVELDGVMTPPLQEGDAMEHVVQETKPFQMPLFDQIPESDQTPITPLNDSGFSSDVSSSPASSEKKRRRSADWYEDDITPPKIFKAY
uniref:Cyclin N-terminal domain-containing protein n=1 Tax=Caenorhabditis tropicalis TaxID=1561998 RepID=A0A1I7UC89_9PELO